MLRPEEIEILKGKWEKAWPSAADYLRSFKSADRAARERGAQDLASGQGTDANGSPL